MTNAVAIKKISDEYKLRAAIVFINNAIGEIEELKMNETEEATTLLESAEDWLNDALDKMEGKIEE